MNRAASIRATSDNASYFRDSPDLSPFPAEPWETYFHQDIDKDSAARRASSSCDATSGYGSPITPEDQPGMICWPDPMLERCLFPGMEDLLLTPPALTDDDNDDNIVWAGPEDHTIVGFESVTTPQVQHQHGKRESTSVSSDLPFCEAAFAGLGSAPLHRPSRQCTDHAVNLSYGILDGPSTEERITTMAVWDIHLPSPAVKGNDDTVVEKQASPLDFMLDLNTLRRDDSMVPAGLVTPPIEQPVGEKLLQLISNDPELRYTIHPLYMAGSDQAGLYNCPFKASTNCDHRSTAIKSVYDKMLDSHVKPFKCKVQGCDVVSFSSTACLLRHEREAHGNHGHGMKPFLCEYPPCERARLGNGFPRMYNLVDHMKRVHGHRVEKKMATPAVLKLSKPKKVRKTRKGSDDVVPSKPRKTSLPTPASSRRSSQAVYAQHCDKAIDFEALCDDLDHGLKAFPDGINGISIPSDWAQSLDEVPHDLTPTLPAFGHDHDMNQL